MFSVYRKMWAAAGFILCLVSVVYAYSDGNGTEAAPYQIASVSDWQQLMGTSSDWSKYFIMTADIDLQGISLTPVGNTTTNFTGVFDGDEYIIYNADMNKPTTDNIGLFGRVGTAGRIRSLDVEDVNMTGNNYVGGLAGYNYGDINDCYVTGTVTGKSNYVGGLTGRNTGTITDCYEIVTVAAGSSSYVGGLTGNNLSTIERCYAAGSVSGNSNVGGLTGRDSGTMTSCYAMGDVSGNSYVGGFAGYKNGGTIATCYSAGIVAGTSYVGGLIGYMTGSSVNNSFWDVETSDCNSSAGGTGKTTAEMQDINTFLTAGWDFVDETVNGTEDIWKICSGTNYPKLAWQIPLLGDFVCPDGVDFYDLVVFVDQWLLEKLSHDIAPAGGDGIVNFMDFAAIANNWQGDMNDFADITSQWLMFSAGCADIAPAGGDGIVDFLDFAVFAENWLEGQD